MERIPVVLTAYARPQHLRRVLACLRENQVPLIHAFLDGSRGEADIRQVEEVRATVRAIDWCETIVTERPENWGLGRNVLDGISQVASRHDAFVVWEDDLVCVPGTYDWICAALKRYADDGRVMSVTAWTHPRITPQGLGNSPYFDARAECWVWGAWKRSWSGMKDATAMEKLAKTEARGLAVAAYGEDLPRQARHEKRRNVWAVRWLYHHFEHGGLCLRPPWSMVEHIGFDSAATNAAEAHEWANPPLGTAPGKPENWPPSIENPECRSLWRTANPHVSFAVRLRGKLRRFGKAAGRRMIPSGLRRRLRALLVPEMFRGDYPDWAAARLASGGYDDRAILAKVLAATKEVQAGRAVFERDSVMFFEPDPDRALLTLLERLAAKEGGRLEVLDFGGSLGSTYWRHRAFLPHGEKLRWDVVEQASFVEAGRRHVNVPQLHFYTTVQAASQQGAHDVLLCSCVLQYLEDPHRFLEEWSRLDIPYVLLNNLPLAKGPKDSIKIQHVPRSIYEATYPVWFFSREAFLDRIRSHYEIVKEFDSEAVWPVGFGMFQSTGLLLKRRMSA